METNYFRRSRSGCLTCRSLHTKCDERKPSCFRCSERGLICGGYAQPLRWKNQNQRKIERIRSPISISLHKDGALSPYNPPHLHCIDQTLLEHWVTVTVPQACLNPEASHELRGMYLHLICHRKHVALHAMLAASAAHMLSLGLIKEEALVQAKQRSIHSMIRELKSFEHINTATSLTVDHHNSATNLGVDYRPRSHHPFAALEDASIIASLLLLGPEIINAGHKKGPAQVRWLLQGARTLIVERHKYFTCLCSLDHPARRQPQFRLDSPVFVSSVRSLVFTDIMTCVPCVRKPYIGQQYWLESAKQSTLKGLQTQRPDPDLGYSAWALSLLGDCAALIEELYTDAISQEVFSVRQETLFRQLQHTAEELEQHESYREHHGLAASMTSGHSRVVCHRLNIAATICHARSAQIFLLRSTNFDKNSACIEQLHNALFESIWSIPMEHCAATALLWPLWVLGCESYPDRTSPTQTEVKAMLLRLYKSQCMKNVEQCLHKLTKDIWRQDHASILDANYGNPRADTQSTWVRRCWEEKIELLLA